MVVVGGAALNLLGLVERATHDVDVIALAEGPEEALRIRPPTPLPSALEEGIATVARDLELSPRWMNVEVASQWRTGLPPSLADGLTWRRFGGLLAGLVARGPMIHLKLYAAADQTGPDSRHFRDLLSLHPSAEELRAASDWIATQDPTIGLTVEKVVARVLADLR